MSCMNTNRYLLLITQSALTIDDISVHYFLWMENDNRSQNIVLQHHKRYLLIGIRITCVVK